MGIVGYNDSFYRTRSLNKCAKIYLRHLPPEVNWLVCRGSSGQMIASAMMVKSKRPLQTLVIRKKEEFAHSGSFAGNNGWSCQKENIMCIVDDFVASGETLRKIMFSAKNSNFYNSIHFLLVDFVEDLNDIKSQYPQLKILELEKLEDL
jgi:orotate phosphoribosyltransferase-like protein